VRLVLRVRRFVCSNESCARRTFAERLGEQIEAYVRRTKRCTAQLQSIGLMLGGNAGSRLAKCMGISVSSDTLLRLVRGYERVISLSEQGYNQDDIATQLRMSRIKVRQLLQGRPIHLCTHHAQPSSRRTCLISSIVLLGRDAIIPYSCIGKSGNVAMMAVAPWSPTTSLNIFEQEKPLEQILPA